MSLISGWVKPTAGVIARGRAGAEADSEQRSPRRRVLRAALCALLLAASGLVTAPARGQSITATVTDNDLPRGIAINPVTNKIYFADDYAGTLTVVDGATNAVSSLSYGANSNWAVVVNPVTNMVYTVDRGLNKVDVFTGATATAPAQFVTPISTGGSNLYAIAINPVTNMIYVCDDGDFRVFVINGSTNTLTTTIPLGGLNAPDSIAVNPATNMIYVGDSVSNNVSVINGTNNSLATTVAVGSSPYSLAVNPATNKIYVANSGSNNVSVIDGSTNTVTATLQDMQASSPVAVAVNPETNQIYVANSGSSNTTIINGANNAVTDVGTNAGTSTFTSVAVDTSTNQVYVANSGNGSVTIINGNGPTPGVTRQLTAQPQTGQIAVNPVTHKAYAADFTNGGPVGITVIDGATNTVKPITPSNQEPAVVAVNPVTNLIYVANSVSNNVSVIDGSTNTVTTVAVGAKPAAIVVDPVNNLVYVANHDGGDITVIDSAFDTSTITFYQTLTPDELAFNPVLNMVYGASRGAGLAFQFSSQDGAQMINANTLFVGTDITAVAVNPAQGYNVYVVNDTPGIQVFDSHGGFTTSTCNASQTPEAMDVNATTNTIYVACGDGTVDIYEQADSFTPGGLYVLTPPSAVRGAAVAVNAATNMAYVADNGSSSVYVINGATIAVTATIPIVSSSSHPVNPVAIAVNVATNKIYVVSQDNQHNTPNVTIIDGATNTILGTIQLTAPGVFTGEIAANPVTGNIYALDWMASTIDVITENSVPPNALQTTINPLPSIGGLPPNSTNTASPTFTFSTLNNLSFSSFSPLMVSAPVTGLYFQVDTQQGSWTPANATPPGSGNFTGTASGITPGFHILYAYATDGEDGAAGNSGAYSAQNGPLVGAIASYGFLVSPPIATINFYPLDFGNTPAGGVSPSPYPILINEGGSPMTYSYAITGPNANEFIVDPNQSSCATSGTLSANSSCEIYVTFQPTTTGPATATLTWTDDSLAISNSMQSIGFTANGVKATTFSNLTLSQSIPASTTSINLSGTISALGSFPPNGETVAITINSATQNATIGTNGVFATAFNTSAIPSSATPYTITYNYPGDANFASAMDSSTTLTVNPLNSAITDTVTLLGTGTGFVIDGQNLHCSETAGVTSGTCSGNYTANSMVVFTANPTAPTTFGGWGGACASSGTSLTCHLTIISSQNVTANFIPPPATVALTFPVGTNPPPQEAVFACPSNTNPCTDPSAHALQLTIPNVSATVGVTVLATEVPPSQADGLCESGNTVSNDFDCRFVTFFSDGTDANNNTIVPLCDPYANGNCVHYLVYSTAGGPGVEPPVSSYSGGVYWQITWNNESFAPPATYYLGSTPQLYDDPDYALTPTSAVGTNCSQPMTINGMNQTYSCQFEFNITTFYNPTQPVDSGVGGSTKQFNDVVVAFPPTVAGTGTIVQPPPTPSTPAITAACLTGCSISGTTINFTIGTGGTFQAVPTGYPAPTLIETGPLPNGLTMNKLTGILSGTPTTTASSSITFTATSTAGTAAQMFTLTVSEASQTITFPASPVSAVYNTTFTAAATSSSGLAVTIAPTGVCTISGSTVTMTSGTGTCTLTASQAGNGNFSPATNVVHTVAAALATQTITFPASPVSAAINTTFTATATSTSSLVVTIAATGACTISGAVVTMTAASGTCSLLASQSGNTNYSAAASKTQSTLATKAGSSTTITSHTPNPSTVNQVVTISFKVTGSGTPTGTVSVTASTGGSCSGTLSSGAGSCTITFTSAGSPTLTAAYAGDGNFNGSTSASVSQTVSGSSSTLKVSPTSLNFGTVYLDRVGVQFVTLTNTGTTPIAISSVKITTPGNAIADFGEITVCVPFIPSMPGTLEPGKTCTIAVGFMDSSKIFSPTASTATIVITDNAPGSPQSIPLSLTVINPQASLSVGNLSFATQKVGTTSAAKTVTLTNTGNTPLTLGTLTVSGNFALASGSGTTCSNNGTVAAGARCAINVTFKPTVKGNNTGSVKIADNALSSPQSISLSGTGN